MNRLQVIDTLLIERSGEKLNAALVGTILELLESGERQFALLEDVKNFRLVGGSAFFGEIGLKLHGIAARFRGSLDQFQCEAEIAAVVDAGFGNNVSGVVRTEAVRLQ